MKILWFTNTPCSASEILKPQSNRGGWLSSLETELSVTKGIELHVAFYLGSIIDDFKHNQTRFHPIYRSGTGSKFKRFIKRISGQDFQDDTEISKLTDVVSKVKPDLIHVHGTEDNFGLIQNYVDIPVLISIQGILNPYLEKYYSGIPASVVNKNTTLIERLTFTGAKYVHEKFKKQAAREITILKNTRFVMGRTEWDKRITKILAPKSRYFTGQEMLRPEFYNRQWSKTKFEEELILITVASGGIYKGFETILKTAAILKDHADFKFNWVVVGIDRTNSIVRLTEKWLGINSSDNAIKLVGPKNENELVELLLGSDLYCQVSHIENSPNSLCEAMILGLPCIASFAGGSGSILKGGEEGILIQDGDPWVLAGTIIELRDNFSMSMKISENSRRAALERHDRSSIIKELTTVYNEILTEDKITVG